MRRLFSNKILFIAAAALAVLVVVLAVLSVLSGGTKTRRSPVPRLSAFQKSAIGTTTDLEIEQSLRVIKKERLSDGRTKYTVQSANSFQPDEIITKNGAVVFERTSTVAVHKPGGFPSKQAYFQQYGEPEAVIKNTELYGLRTSIYLYAGKGFAVHAKRYTNDVLEIQEFTPMTKDEYMKTYKQYIPNEQPHAF